jgi:hypothetical protein
MRLVAGAWMAPGPQSISVPALAPALCGGLIAGTLTKLVVEAAVFSWLSAKTLTPLRRTAVLLTGVLARATAVRFVCGAIGGCALPALLWSLYAPGSVASAPVMFGLAWLMLALVFAGELMERYLFFAAVVAPKMPGAPSA